MTKPCVRMIASVSLVLVVILAGCQMHRPESNFDRLSSAMQVNTITTDQYQHLVGIRMAQKASNALHVYIEGDGSPWLRRYFVSRDPTPRYVLALQMMLRDTQSDTVYLGRPCYFNSAYYGLADDACHPSLWTSRRYSEEVVESMITALRQARDLQQYERVVIIGHSGGGTLATLMGNRMQDEVDVVVSIAANLDTTAWTRHHGFSPLFGSLNPTEDIVASGVRQIHWVGGKDDIVPPSLNQTFAEAAGISLHIIDDFDHNCCWLKCWPALLYTALANEPSQN